MAWQIRRTNQDDGSNEVQGITHSTAAIAYDVAMDNAQATAKQLLLDAPTLKGFKMKFYRDTGAKGFKILLLTSVEKEVAWFVEEV